MGKYFDEIPQFMIQWILKQHLFWVATAPLSGTGHVNVSPKGTADCFHIVDSQKVWYEDLSGSGIETISHLREPGNGRIRTVMFQAFDGPACIVRLFGYGTVHEFATPEFDALISPDMRKPGTRAAIVIDVYQTMTSCGYAVPFYKFLGHRHELVRYFVKREASDQRAIEEDSAEAKADSLKTFWTKYNLASRDGLPALLTAPESDVVPTSTLRRDTKEDNTATKAAKRMQMKTIAKLDPHITLIAGFVLGIFVASVLSKWIMTPQPQLIFLHEL